MTQNTSIDVNRHLLYYTIRLQNSADDTLHAWMRHILAYLSNSANTINRSNNNRNDGFADDDNEEALEQTAHLADDTALQPHHIHGDGCDGSCDCQTNGWVREVSYEQHCRKLLTSRVNVGDTHATGGVDEDSLRHEASMVMESVNGGGGGIVGRAGSNALAADELSAMIGLETSIDVDMTDALLDCDESSGRSSSEWDFLLYDSDGDDNQSDTSFDDPSYKPCGSDLVKLGSEYSSEGDTDDNADTDDDTYDEDELDDVDRLSSYTYDVRLSATLNLNAASTANDVNRRTVNLLGHYHKNPIRRRRPRSSAFQERSVVSADDSREYFFENSDDERDVQYEPRTWERPSSTD